MAADTYYRTFFKFDVLFSSKSPPTSFTGVPRQNRYMTTRAYITSNFDYIFYATDVFVTQSSAGLDSK